MKVILLQNVSRLGQKGDIKDVSEGYAINLLIPRKLAKFASEEEVNKLNTQKIAKQKKVEFLHNKAHALIDKVADKELVMKTKANDKGHLFAQIHIKEIADAIGDLGIDISEDWIILKNPIKEVGEFEIKLEAYGKKTAVKLKIIPE